MAAQNHPFNIYLRNMAGDEIIIENMPTDSTISELKAEIKKNQQYNEFDLSQINLSMMKDDSIVELLDNKMISYYNIVKDDSTKDTPINIYIGNIKLKYNASSRSRFNQFVVKYIHNPNMDDSVYYIDIPNDTVDMQKSYIMSDGIIPGLVFYIVHPTMKDKGLECKIIEIGNIYKLDGWPLSRSLIIQIMTDKGYDIYVDMGRSSDFLTHLFNMGRIKMKVASEGGRKRTVKRSKTRRMKGGFVPSVMGNFLFGASKYITPLALFAGYKLYTKTKNTRRSTRRSTRSIRK